MNRSDFQRISKLRLKDARVLLQSHQYAGSYYMAGYAVECALKACIAKRVGKNDFPDLETVKRSYSHDLEQLCKTAGLFGELDKDLEADENLDANWGVVKDWSTATRYNTGVTAQEARDLYGACTTRASGVLKWIKARW
jgi:HEPN domain-containing protein